ncbi:FAM72 protein [Ordospora pajunii]|uniref:FAM72 protein n=1 Tax=Ordospora pajunii TaxID=3039483 RepID=UPI0029528F3B|nr:FAM72 protein [Ordospora pajunii]KAH9411090.1 FAM72 protein [Ordospora pajunii]
MHEQSKKMDCGDTEYVIRCFGCLSIVCRRARRSMLLLNTKIKIYSGSNPTECVQSARNGYMAYMCKCIVADIRCKCCRMVLGYHIVRPCIKCTAGTGNSHRWIFDTSSVKSSARQAGYEMQACDLQHFGTDYDHEIKIR